MIRTIFAWLCGIFLTIILGSFSTIFSFFDKSGKSAHFFMKIWSKSCLFVSACKVKISGLENLPKNSPLIIITNHQSLFDIFILAAYLPIQFAWLAKRELFKIPFLGWHMKQAKYIPVERHNKDKAKNCLIDAKKRLDEKISVVFFPEGTRSKNGTIGNFKLGAFLLSKDTNIPVLPIVINGSRDILIAKTLKINPGNVSLTIKKPISPISFTDTEEYAKFVRELIVKELK